MSVGAPLSLPSVPLASAAAGPLGSGLRVPPGSRCPPVRAPAGAVGRRSPGGRSGQGRGPGVPLHAQHAVRLLTALRRLLRAVGRQEHLLQLRPRDPGPLSAQGALARSGCAGLVWPGLWAHWGVGVVGAACHVPSRPRRFSPRPPEVPLLRHYPHPPFPVWGVKTGQGFLPTSPRERVPAPEGNWYSPSQLRSGGVGVCE